MNISLVQPYSDLNFENKYCPKNVVITMKDPIKIVSLKIVIRDT